MFPLLCKNKYVEYIERGDVSKARKLLRMHLQALREQEELLVTNWSEYFNTDSIEMTR